MKLKHLPKKIYLQIGENCIENDFNIITRNYEITWCVDKIYNNDICYYKNSKPTLSVEEIEEIIDNVYDVDDGISCIPFKNSADTLANVLSKLKIWLIENKYMEVG